MRAAAPNAVFVLCSDGRDEYAPMTFVAVSLLKSLHPEMRVVLLTDEFSLPALRKEKAAVLHAADSVEEVETGIENPRLRSRFLKTVMRTHVRGDMIFLDSDALVMRRLDHIAGGDTEVAAALNRDGESIKPIFTSWVRPLYAEMGWKPTRRYFNSGVVYMVDNDRTRSLAASWHEGWKELHARTGKYQDQPAFNHALEESGARVKTLPVSYNAPVECWAACARGARVFHYYSSVSGAPHRTLLHKLMEILGSSGKIDWELVERARRNSNPWVGRLHDLDRLLATGHYGEAGRVFARRCWNKLRRKFA